MESDRELYDSLFLYTLERGDAAFMHQHIVDAYAAQHADANTRPITIVFALIGLYLYLEKNFTGRQVQRAHMQLAKNHEHLKDRKPWTAPFTRPRCAVIGVADVLAAAPGAERDTMIRRWCEAVWQDWHESRARIAALAQTELGVAP